MINDLEKAAQINITRRISPALNQQVENLVENFEILSLQRKEIISSIETNYEILQAKEKTFTYELNAIKGLKESLVDVIQVVNDTTKISEVQPIESSKHIWLGPVLTSVFLALVLLIGYILWQPPLHPEERLVLDWYWNISQADQLRVIEQAQRLR